MKIIGRTLALLIAALAVVGLTLAFTQSSYGQRLFSGRPGGPAVMRGQDGGARPGRNEGGFMEGRRGGEFERGERHGVGFFGIAEIGKSLGIIAVVTAVVALATQFGRKLRPAARKPQPPAPPEPLSQG